MSFTSGRSLQPRGGSSGATITIRNSYVAKKGEPRVGEQGRWLLLHRSGHLPTIQSTSTYSYTMERLAERGPTSLYEGRRCLGAMYTALNNSVWMRPAEVKMDWPAHLAKLGAIADGDYLHRLTDTAERIDWDSLPTCLTHGDPTWDNVMFRDDTMVLIDPLPATTAVPDIRAVDLGKMMQSVVGFEGARYGAIHTLCDVEPHDVEALCANANEWLAAQYWCAVHLLRAVPYMDEEVKPRVAALARSVVDCL